MAVGFRGSSSSGGSSGINFDSDYFKVDPSPLGVKLSAAEKSSMGYDGGGSGSAGSTGPLGGYNPIPGIGKNNNVSGIAGNEFYGSSPRITGEGPPTLGTPDYFTKAGILTQEDKARYLDDIGGFVYNPGTGQFEAGSYLLDSIAPEYSDYYDTMLLGLNNPEGLTGSQLQDIENNRLNVQKGILDITANNPGANAQDVIDSYNESFTGFDSSGNFTGAPVDPGTAAMNAIPDFSQPTQSVFDDGGLFSFFNKGGKVTTSNGGK